VRHHQLQQQTHHGVAHGQLQQHGVLLLLLLQMLVPGPEGMGLSATTAACCVVQLAQEMHQQQYRRLHQGSI